MTFEEILDQAMAMLQRRGRLTYSTLKRQFQLDDAALEDVKNEFIYGQRLAVDEEDRVLVWTGELLSTTSPTSAPSPVRAIAPAHVPLVVTPVHLAEKIVTSRSALEGERKQITVLFADLKGSMELLADRDPEEARQLLDPVLERMIEAVHRYEGTVNQVMGDGIMALFGAPIAHEDHAVRACYAALRMQETVTRYGDEMQRSHGVPVQIRVGLNSGEVVVRGIDSSLHMDYTAVGQTTHLAARLEQMARPGSVLITRETLRLVEGFIQVKALGPVAVRGLADPVEVLELVGASATRTRLQALAARGLTRFVGRQAEFEALRQALERASASHGQVVAVIGEPGGGQDPPGLRVPPVPSHPRLAPARKQFGLLRQGHRLPPRARPAQGLLPGRRPRRRTEDPREAHRQAPHPGCDPRADPAGLPRAPGHASGGHDNGRTSIPRNAASAPSRPSNTCCCARARCSRCSWSSRTCTGLTPRRRRSSTA